MLSNDGCLLKLLKSSKQQKSTVHDYTLQEVYKSTLACIESILLHLELSDDFEINHEYLESVGKSLIKFLYTFKQNEIQDNDFITIVTMAINSLKLICQESHDFSTENVGELLGISKAFMMYALTDIPQKVPTKIVSSQQAVFDPANSRQLSVKNVKKSGAAGGMSKNKKQLKGGGKGKKNENKLEHKRLNKDSLSHFSLYRTSDSDFSDNEHTREIVNRNKQSKLRLTSLSLILVLATMIDKKIVFGYWHSLLSTDEESMCITLVNCILKDTSPRCKIVALQIIIQLLKNSKQFLIQAENKEKVPSTFTPFSVTLGNMISFTYEKLTQAMIKEGDLTVLTQILKCLSAFISVTPFHRLRSGIVTAFIKYIRLLVRHKDPTIKVAALIVMENLISIQDVTSEIYEIVEIPKSKIEFSLKKIDESIRMLQPKNEDEMIELEFEEEEYNEDENLQDEDSMEKLVISSSKMSWLLQTVLENLGIYNGILKSPSISVSVRVESLQILTAMTSHFLLLKDHLLSISTALSKSLHDAPADEKLFASRALECLGNAINNFLSQGETLSFLNKLNFLIFLFKFVIRR
jgi:hypothetical protein